MALRDQLEAIWWAGVKSVSGYEAVRNALSKNADFQPTHIISIGKAASGMARAALDGIDPNLPCIVVTKYAHGEAELADYENLELIESAHPVPDLNSLRAGEALIEFIDALSNNANLLVLVSGGASALAESLPQGLSLIDLQKLNETMLADGLDIHAINKKRKEISRIKAGKLLDRFSGNSALVFAISDVEGDNVAVVGSGIGEVNKSAICKNMCTQIIASNAIARSACEKKALELGYNVVENVENLYADIDELAPILGRKIKNSKKGILIFGGEPTTILPNNPGEGGRNQALATAMAREISGIECSILVAGTDGSDGPTNAAGGFVCGTDWNKYSGGATALKKADCGNWLRKTGGLFETGPTGTNVMDIMLVIKS